MARYVHFDVSVSRRSQKQIQPISSENIEICLVRFKSISCGNMSTISENLREMGLFRESSWFIVSTLIGSASAGDFIASTLILDESVLSFSESGDRLNKAFLRHLF